MTSLKLKFESNDEIIKSDLSVMINDLIIDYQIINDELELSWDQDFGIHLLKVKSLSNKNLKIVDFLINNESIGTFLYLGYKIVDNIKYDSTSLTSQDKEITIPFGYPLGWWNALCINKFNNTDLGNNLYSKFEIYYPTSIDISDSDYSNSQKEFFKYNFDFTVVNKKEFANPLHNPVVPYVKINLEYDERKLFDEFELNYSQLFNDNWELSQKVDKSNPWNVSMCIPMGINHQKDTKAWKDSYIYDPDLFPNLYQLFESISNLGDVFISHCAIGYVKPNVVVKPHRDDLSVIAPESGYNDLGGLCQFFIPINWKQGNLYKFSNIGLINYNSGALLTNNHNYAHGSVNLSSESRYTIIIYCKFTGDSILKC